MVARQVRWSVAARRDLFDIVDHIASDSALDAEAVLGRLQQQAASLERFAERGRRIPELKGRKQPPGANWRELLARPWRIVYAIDGDTVLVLAVVDGRRDFRAWLSGRSVVGRP